MAPNKPSPRKPNSAFVERFIAEYLVELNASEAYRRAGYKGKNAHVQSSRLMKDPEVAAAVKAGLAARMHRIEITQERVIKELALLAFSDLQHYTVDASGTIQLAPGAPEGAHRALQSIKRRTIITSSDGESRTVHEVELKLWDKVTPLIRAGRHVDVHGFSDRVEHTGKDGAPIATVALYQLPINGREKSA